MFGNFFNRMYYGDPHKPDLKSEDIPKKGVALFWDILKNNFWQLINLNLLFILFCIPILSIGPSLAGLNNVLRNHALGRNVWLWNDFKEGAIKNFKQSFFITLLNGVIAFVLINNFRVYSSLSAGFIKIIGIYVTLLIGLIFILINVFTYPLLVTYKLKIWHIYKNSFIFSIISLPKTIGIVILCIVILLVSILLGAIPLVLIGFSFIGLIINVYDRSLFEKYIDKRMQDKTNKITNSKKNEK